MNVFERVKALKPPRSAFNLSYEKKFTCDMGQLIPIMHDEVVPGDTFKIGIELVVRFLPLVAPILHEVNAFVHYFFVPYRLLWEDWEEFITGGVDGDDESVLPTWIPAGTGITNDNGDTPNDNSAGSLWDFLGFPTGTIPAGAYPIDFPKRAYNLVWNEYYRDQTQQAELNITTSNVVKNRCWEKDFFTSALPWQQRGTAPALPISGTSSAAWISGTFASTGGFDPLTGSTATSTDPIFRFSNANAATNVRNALNTNTVDLSSATTFDVSDLRLAFQIQKWMERNARAGARYTEFLLSHYGVAPKDERLQRPEYIGGTKLPVIVSEVLNTSDTTNAVQGAMAGHAIAAGRDYCAKYHATEFGIILGILSIVPRTAYSQGINRQWLKQTRYDFYSPEWAHLSEQAIIRAEVYANSTSGDNTTLFGYQGRFNEMRSKLNLVAGQMRYTATYAFWHLGRFFASAPALNETFLRCIPRKTGVFAAPTQPSCIVNAANIIKAIRPMPVDPDPGLIDHA